LIFAAAQQTAVADEFYREDLRIAMAAAEPGGLEAMLVRPSGGGRYPLALISHGSPRDEATRATMSPYGLHRQAIEFARRGFAALVVMRRGYGTSGGPYAESSGPCAHRDYLKSAVTSTGDLRAAIDAMKGRTDVSTEIMIAVGVSAGGLASVALTADPPAASRPRSALPAVADRAPMTTSATRTRWSAPSRHSARRRAFRWVDLRAE